ncbi:hypothetical protein C0Q70_16409 [Pomacea canaliculata]|uniref:Uncharacterized protein n=1 Tax=Pomacea canaliculata TaxID=400727 RepID=A0A2T7NPS0_POMCA|nr:hypothetical protein C0Q70_16409 [Pomacea canaliculata]
MLDRGKLSFIRTADQCEARRDKRKMRFKQALVSVVALVGLAYYVYFLRSSSQRSMLDTQAAQDGIAMQPDDAMIVRMAAFLNASGKIGQEDDDEEEMDGFHTDMSLDAIPPPGDDSPEKQNIEVKMEPMDDPLNLKGDDNGLKTDIMLGSTSTFHPSDIKRLGNDSSQQEVRPIEIMPQQKEVDVPQQPPEIKLEQPPAANFQQPPVVMVQQPPEASPQKPPVVMVQQPPEASPQKPPVFIPLQPLQENPQQPPWVKPQQLQVAVPQQPPLFIPQQPLEVHPQKPSWVKPLHPPAFIPQQPPVAKVQRLQEKLRQPKDSNSHVVDAAQIFENVRQRGHQYVQQNSDSRLKPPFQLLPDNMAKSGVGPNPASAQNDANNQHVLNSGLVVKAVNSDIGETWSGNRFLVPQAGRRSVNRNQANVAFNRR